MNIQSGLDVINHLSKPVSVCMCVRVCSIYQAITDGLQLASRLATRDSWGCGGNSVIATGSAHVAGVKTCCLLGLPS